MARPRDLATYTLALRMGQALEVFQPRKECSLRLAEEITWKLSDAWDAWGDAAVKGTRRQGNQIVSHLHRLLDEPAMEPEIPGRLPSPVPNIFEQLDFQINRLSR